MKKKFIIAFCLILAANYSAFAGNETVEGHVFNGKDAVPDVAVKSSANDKTVKTNRKGHFRIKGISTGEDTIFVRITDNESLEIPLWGANRITVRRMEDSVFVERDRKEETVSSTYGGTVFTRSSLEKTGETNLLKSIALRVPGVEYVQDNLLIRGVKSFSLNNFPLYILDGVETSQVSYLTVMEVETVEILKDASASMFGVKGSNGVVIINRKK